MLEIRGVQKSDRQALVCEHEGHIVIDLGCYARQSFGPKQARHIADSLYEFAARIEARTDQRENGKSEQ